MAVPSGSAPSNSGEREPDVQTSKKNVCIDASGPDFNLSEKKVNWNQGDVIPSSDIWYVERHVKTFIKKLLEGLMIDPYKMEEFNKLCGEELSER